MRMVPIIVDKNRLLNEMDDLGINKVGISDYVDSITVKDYAKDIVLFFNSEWFKYHKDLGMDILRSFIKNYKRNDLCIDSAKLIDDSIIDAICSNDNIKNIILGKNSNDSYFLSLKHFDKLSDANKEIIDTYCVEDELSNYYDSSIKYNMTKKLIGNYNYRDLNGSSIHLNKNLSDDELSNLEYIGNNTVVNVNSNINFFDIIHKIRELGKDNRIIISYTNKNDFNKKMSIFTEGYINESGIVPVNNNYVFDDNIYIKSKTDFISIPISDYADYENTLYLAVKGARELSPLEKYLYAYDVTKKFKEYRKNELENKNIGDYDYFTQYEIKESSRNLYEVLDNNYIVCAGFVNILKDLLYKLGIPCVDYGVDIDLSVHRAVKQMKGITPNWKELNGLEKRKIILEQQNYIPKDLYEGHKRLIVSIRDNKYGVDGYYFSDPTWDSDLDENIYTHVLMTSNDVDNSIFKSKLDFISSNDLFFARDMDEFNKMLGVLFDKNMDFLYKTAKERLTEDDEFNECDIKFDIKFQFIYFIKSYVSSVITLFPKVGELLKEKYPFINGNDWPMDENIISEDVKKLICDCASLTLSKSNKDVKRDTLISALKEVYNHIYTNGLTDDDISLINKNLDKEQDFEFGYRK